MRTSNLTILTVLMLLFVLAVLPAYSQETEQANRKAPDFTLRSFEGYKYRLRDYNDTIVVLEWFNYECPFVKYHHQDANAMTALENKYDDENLIWFAINSTSHATKEKTLEFAEQNNITYPILDDRDGKTGHKYSAKTTPHMFIIDKGYIVYEGAIDNAPLGKVPKGRNYVNYVDKVLEEVFADKSVTTPETKPYGCSVKYRD